MATIRVDDVTFAEANFQNIPLQTVLVDDCFLGINDFQSSFISLYPNPARDFIAIDSSESISEIKVYNMLGELILEFNDTQKTNSLDLTSLTPGLYFIGVSVEGTKRNFRIVKH